MDFARTRLAPRDIDRTARLIPWPVPPTDTAVSSVDARLELLCDVNRRLATFTSLDDLLAYATGRLREVFDAQGCALLLVDRARGEFRFPISSQRAASGVSAAQLSEIRFPSTKGIAGWVLAHGEAVCVDDAQHDARFYSGVDHTTGWTTRQLLAAPLRTSEDTIGVIEVINPVRVSDGDLALLEALGSDIAVAHQRAEFCAALRAEAAGIRRLTQFGTLALIVLGVGFVLVGAFVHAARALPMREMAGEPGVLGGVLVALAGLQLRAAVRRVPSAA